jgi:hypothetical protein
MSLLHIQRRPEPTIFGDDLNVLIADTTINGNLDIQGAVNGTSSQGQNTNNVWTGTNDFSTFRPTCPIAPVGLTDGVKFGSLTSEITDAGVINKGSTWTGTNTFTQNVVVPTTAPVNATDGASTQYVIDSWTTKLNSYYSANNTWTGTNTFNVLPLVQEPLTNTSIASLNYVTNTLANVVVTDATSVASQVAITNEVWDNSFLASVQIIGGGGGSTSSVGTCVCSSAGVSGGSGSTASLLILLASKLYATTCAGTFSIAVGGGGGAGSGCGTGSGSGGGGATNLYVTPTIASGFNQTQVNLLRANGGGGFGGYCGEPGNSAGGTYSNINPLVVSPYSYLNGRGGSQCAGAIPQYAGINTFGWGARGASCANGAGGSSGGYGLTRFTFPA